MTSSTLKTAILSTAIATCFVFISLAGVHAQTASVSGDELCGSSAATVCTPSDLKEMTKRLLAIFATLGSVLLVVLILVRFVRSYFAYLRGDAGAIKRAGEGALNALIGFAIIFAVFGGVFLIMINYLGTQPWVSELLRAFSYGLVEHAYAQENLLPNPYGSNSLYDIIIAAANLVMRFFVYPGLIVAWVASGFKFIYSQGNPEGLKTARDWLFKAFIITIVAFTLQGFILAFKATAQKIIPNTESSVTTPSPSGSQVGTPDGRTAPQPKTPGAQCQENGLYGIWTTDGKCNVTSRGSTTNTTQGRGLVGVGGSCRIDVECSGALICSGGVCKASSTP